MVLIRKGNVSDIKDVVRIYNNVLSNEENGDVTIGWIRDIYPTEKTALEALKNDSLFVMEDEGNIVAACKIDQNQVPEYANAKWKYKDIDNEQVMVLHTLVVDPNCSKKGYGTKFVDFYERYALDNDCPYLRMDTNEINSNARRLYARLGYKEVDIVPCVFNGIPDVKLVCLEKTLL